MSAQAVGFMTHAAKTDLVDPCMLLLEQHMAGMLQRDVESLSDAGRDRMFNGVSALFAKIFTVLREVIHPVEADQKVPFSTPVHLGHTWYAAWGRHELYRILLSGLRLPIGVSPPIQVMCI